MGERLRAGMPSRYVTSQLGQLMRSCIPPGSLNRVPALAGGTGGNVISAGWQVTLCDPIWHVSSRSGVAGLHRELLSVFTFCLYAATQFAAVSVAVH